MNTPLAHVRPRHARTRNRLSRTANARDTITEWTRGMDMFALTFGQFSLIDLIDAVTEKTGPAHVVICTWSAGFYDVDAARAWRDSGRLQSVRFIMDSSDKRNQAGPGEVSAIFGPDSVRTTRTHSKYATITTPTPDPWHVVITTSMNLNLNPRCEHFTLSDDPGRYELLDSITRALWEELPPGSTGDRTTPTLRALDDINIPATCNIRAAQTIRTGNRKD